MKPNRRYGYSLVEVVAVLGVSTVIAGMAIWLVHVSMQKSRDGQKHLAMHNTMARLADTFRGDIHAAVTIAEEKAEKQDYETSSCTWIISLASGGAVRYHLEPGRLNRYEFATLPASDKDAKKPLNQDSFKLPAEWVVSIELQPTSKPQIATLFVTRPDAGSKSQAFAGGPLLDRQRIDAAVSSDNRFDKVSIRTSKKTTDAKDTNK